MKFFVIEFSYLIFGYNDQIRDATNLSPDCGSTDLLFLNKSLDCNNLMQSWL